MPGDLGMSWDVAAVTTTVGGTAVATYTATMPGGDPRKAELDTLLGGIATAEVSSGSVTFTGVSVGEVTIPPYSQVGNSVYSGNPITISVTAPTEDESYLNKRGLTHFWNNIDTLKQDKLTAGAGILITNDVISATGGGTADAVAWGHITGTMADQTDLMTALGAKANSTDLATVATSGSYNDLSNRPDIMTGLTEMSYGESNAWAKFITAYRAKQIVYCRASSNSNPATGAQGRKAFMAYVNNAENPTEVEFQYVRSVGTKTASQPVDQVYVYKLTSANGGTWTVQTRDMGPKLVQGTNTTVSYSNGTYTISATGGGGGGPTVVQTTGQSTTDVMSQKAVTDIIGNVETILRTLNSGTGAA